MGADLITIVNAEGTLRAGINPENGQLCSLEVVRDGRPVEFMWGGGKPAHLKAPHEKKEAGGWQNSAIVMFPLVSQALNDRVTIGGRELVMPQHGIARYMRPIISGQGEAYATAAYVHEGNPAVQTPKGEVKFPHSFRLIVYYQTNDNRLEVNFEVENLSARLPLPFALGWHPAFLDLGGTVETNHKKLTVEEIAEASASAAHGAIILPGETDAKYTSADGGLKVAMNTWGFGNMQVWRQPASQPASFVHRADLRLATNKTCGRVC